jgi:hypothetical protein
MVTKFMTLYCVAWTYEDHQTIIMASEDREMSKQSTAGKRKHITLVIPDT